MHLGNRVFYDQDGAIIYQTGEMQGDVMPRKQITELHCVDIEYGMVDLNTHRIIGIDHLTKQPILEELPIIFTPDQQRIKELEDQLLLLADQAAGGIL